MLSRGDSLDNDPFAVGFCAAFHGFVFYRYEPIYTIDAHNPQNVVEQSGKLVEYRPKTTRGR